MMPSPTSPVIAAIKDRLAGKTSPLIENFPWPIQQRILVLAPHPDDFDAIAVTLRFFRDRGDEIRLSILSSSASGVENTFCNPPTAAVKAAIREREQRASCRLFGLPDEHLVFLRLAEDGTGHPYDNDENFECLCTHLQEARPTLVFLPHGNDTNVGHRVTFQMLRRFAVQSDFPLVVFLNRDPKTTGMRSDLYTFFGEEDARWKAELLRCHCSQQQRNLNFRGYGLDERILRVNRQAAAEIPAGGPYAEVFEIWSPDLED